MMNDICTHRRETKEDPVETLQIVRTQTYKYNSISTSPV